MGSVNTLMDTEKSRERERERMRTEEEEETEEIDYEEVKGYLKQ